MTTSIASRKSQGKCSSKIALFSIATVILIGSAGNINAQNNLIPAVRPCLADSFTPVTQSMGDPNLRYIDPEVLRGSDKIAYQDKAGNLWVGTLDATTGKFASQTGHDLLVDTDLANIDISYNGPEWGLDVSGTALFYTKPDVQGTLQMWRASITRSSGLIIKQLTGDIQPSSGLRPSFLAGTDMTYIFFLKGMLTDSEMVWAMESDANTVSPVINYWYPSGGGRFVAGPDPKQPLLVFVRQDASTLETQIALMDTASGHTKLITNDAGEKFEPRPFNAPEYGGELLLAVIIDRLTLAIYRNLGDPDGYWTRIEEMQLPESETNTALYSMKPVASPKGKIGINGISYFSLAAYQINSRSHPGDTSLWLLGLGSDSNGRFCRKVDEGSIPDKPQTRYEPETYLGTSDLFFYYNIENAVDPELGQIRVVNTGISY
jgi:hypothetical protein